MGYHVLVHVSDSSTSICGLHWPPFGKPESKNKCYWSWSTLSLAPTRLLLLIDLDDLSCSRFFFLGLFARLILMIEYQGCSFPCFVLSFLVYMTLMFISHLIYTYGTTGSEPLRRLTWKKGSFCFISLLASLGPGLCCYRDPHAFTSHQAFFGGLACVFTYIPIFPDADVVHLLFSLGNFSIFERVSLDRDLLDFSFYDLFSFDRTVFHCC